MNKAHVERLANELKLKDTQVASVMALLAEGSTVPFIARYRKEATGSLDEVAITSIRDRSIQLEQMDARRQTILKSIEEQGKLTDELKARIDAADTPAALEDLYLPFRPKRRTRATMAREKGLEPLADLLLAQGPIDPAREAEAFVNAEKGVADADEALAGARDIIAERVSEDPAAREKIRKLYFSKGVFRSRVVPGKETEGAKFRDYFEWEEPVAAAPSHRVLAMRRGENELILALRIVAPETDALALLDEMFLKARNPAAEQVRLAIEDGFKRLLAPSMETEVRLETKKRADEEAIRVFAENLRQLLLAPPLGQKNVLALDPGYRTGCKLVCLDRQGRLVHSDTIFPHQSERQVREAADTVLDCCRRFGIEAIAIGNGTAGRETEAFVRGLNLPAEIVVVMVSESGASVYSASETAREEFPDQDVTVRGSVSIGRRLIDPLAELVKIDPKAIGVGQYQHDVDQGALKGALDDVVVSCVNSVGVDLNTASKQLLTYVSGLGPKLAQAIVEHRNQHGAFRTRQDLMNVPRLGPKAFQQAAGFLRIRDAENPLDASAVHPESYAVVDRMAQDCGCSVTDLMRDPTRRARIDLKRYLTDTVGLPTLNDILEELAKPGRDPRKQFEIFRFAEGVNEIKDLKPGMRLPGVVTNITAFGAFVDVGVHQDGLVHVSQLADRFVKDPGEVVKVHQKVMVTVLEVDLERNRISLTMRERPREEGGRPRAGAPAAGRGQPPRREPPRERTLGDVLKNMRKP